MCTCESMELRCFSTVTQSARHCRILILQILQMLNIGTNNGTSCALTVQNTVLGIWRRSPDYTVVLNGRFKGGFTTQQYGNPSEGIHAIQMELAQSTYMQESVTLDLMM